MLYLWCHCFIKADDSFSKIEIGQFLQINSKGEVCWAVEFLQHDVYRKLYMVIVLTDFGDELAHWNTFSTYTWEWWMDVNEGYFISWTFPKYTNGKSI